MDSDSLPIIDILLNDSQLSNNTEVNCTAPTSGQKWWTAIILGFIFAFISSPAAYYATSTVSTSLGGMSMVNGPGANFIGLFVHMWLFIFIVRIILW